MLRRYEILHSPAVGKGVQVLAYGHYGAPSHRLSVGGRAVF